MYLTTIARCHIMGARARRNLRMKNAIVNMAKAFAKLLDAYYAEYDTATSALMVALADWVKANGGEI